jgi:cellulose biosynthesis protein BcsQ
MKVVTVAAAKGGSCKSTVASLLAVRAAMESAKVGMFDLNGDQGSLTQWWLARGEPLNPRLLSVEKIGRDVEVARSMNFEWLILDTPPGNLDVIEVAIVKADAVVVPVRPSLFDVEAVEAVVEMCRERMRPFAFLLAAVDARMPKMVDAAVKELVRRGPVFATRISYRQDYIQAVGRGKVAFEIEKKGPKGERPLKDEADALWEEAKRLCRTIAPMARERAAQ